MASPTEPTDDPIFPGNRKASHSFTSTFMKTKKGGDVRNRPAQSPSKSMKWAAEPATDSSVVHTSSPAPGETSTEPIAIPVLIKNSSHKQKKLAPSNPFNTHYRTISRSMNDLGNIFSRGRSPPNRETPIRSSASICAIDRRGGIILDPSRAKNLESGSVPSISVMQYREPATCVHVIHEGWLNVIDSEIKKTTSLRDSWKLHYAMIIEGQMLLYKSPSSFQIKAFEFGIGSPSPQRPQSAPTISSPAFNGSRLRHNSTSRHPELVLRDDGTVGGGTVEALCHELLFTSDPVYVHWSARSISGWTGPETALSVLIELSALQDSSSRIGEILNIMATATPGLLLESDCYYCAKLLAEKGIGHYNPKLAKSSRMTIESVRAHLRQTLDIVNTHDAPKSSFTDNFTGLCQSLSAEDFLRINPDVFAAQVHLFHLKYFRAWSPAEDISLLLVSPHLPPLSHRNPLVFSTSNIHFLGHRVLHHVLCGESAIDIDRRVAVLSRWIEVAQLLKVTGDMVGYLAIMMAVLSPAILRLRETWTSISPVLINELKDTAGNAMRILERRRLNEQSDTSDGRAFVPKGVGVEFPCLEGVPFFGDLLHCMDQAYARHDQSIDYFLMVQGLQGIEKSLAKWRQDWIDTSPGLKSRKWIDTTEAEHIQNCLHFLNSNNQNSASINSSLYFEKSLVCEPSWTGIYLQSHYHQKLPLSTGANIPLIFTDIRASFSLFDRSDTLAISGTLHKKTPSSGLGSPISVSSAYPAGTQSNQSLRLPTSHGQQKQTLRRIRSFPPSKPSAQTTGYDDLDFTTLQRTAVLQGGDDAMLRAIRDVAGVNQQLFHSKDGELVLKSITDGSQSRPTSMIETTSNRQSLVSRRRSQMLSTSVSPTASTNWDNGVPTLAQEGFDVDNPLPLLVVPKGGTLERLVDILVLGVEDFSRRMISAEGQCAPKSPLLRMNMDVFTITFFATFRSYCSPIVLIDYLKKRLLGSKSAASSSCDERDDVVFPDWTGVDQVKDEAIDWFLVAKIHLGILDAIDVWLSEFYMDFHCDQYLGESFVSFFDIADKELYIWQSLTPDKFLLRKQAEEITLLWHGIKEKFANLSFTPSAYESLSVRGSNTSLNVPQHEDIGRISEFIEILDLRVAEFFAAVKLVDWMFAFELLETKSVEPMGFFVPKVSHLSHDDEDALQDIFFFLDKLPGKDPKMNLVQALPKCLRDICTLHMELTSWIVSQVAEPKIGAEIRSQRIATLLKSLTICHQRMSGMDLHENTDSGVSRHVPSFVGNAIATALVRPESRIFSHAWQLGAKLACGSVSSYETLEQVIPHTVPGVIPSRPLTTSVGWMIERLLEIVCHVPNMVVENNRLINFDKRRYVYNFINNFTNERVYRAGDRCQLNCFIPRTAETYDIRTLREVANKENQISRHRAKIFWKLLNQEHEKVRRDSKQREAMERQQRNQLRAEHRRQPTAMRVEAMDKKGGKRLGVNSIFKAVRPISMAFTNGWTPPLNALRMVPSSELPSFKALEYGRKPVATIDLKLVASISCPRKTREQGLWKITPSIGTSYLLQATSENDLDDWLRAINAIRGMSTTDGAESIDLLTLVSQNRSPQPVFGVALEELCKRDNVKIPLVVEGLLTEIETRGLTEVGIYRVPGSLSSINQLKTALDSGEDVKMDDDRWYDINVIAGTFKCFMRELPDQALEPDILHELRDLTAKISEEVDRILPYRDVMLQLRPPNYRFLRRVYTHFSRIARNAAVNKMHAVNLAIVFGMGLSPSTTHPFGVSPDLGLYQTMVKTWINYADQIFPDVEDDDEGSVSIVRAGSAGILSVPASRLSAAHIKSSPSQEMSLEDQHPVPTGRS
ncbi:hypothetical protein K440DRAFT_583210 [Wilcoxina mikolae CBS 423.85]|nr:hypothetical protein K440DRAFT_583210 [Wilcoxina mikolae CBS 423.85]